MTESRSSHTEQIIDQYYQYLKARDRVGLASILSADIKVIYHAENSRLPWAGTWEGIDGFDAFLEVIKTHLDIVEVTIDDRIFSEQKAIMQCRGIWRRRSSGAEIRGGMVNVFTLSEKQIKQYEVYADTAAFQTVMDENSNT